MISTPSREKGANAEIKDLVWQLKEANRMVIKLAMKNKALQDRCHRLGNMITALILVILIAISILGAWWNR